VQLHIETRHAHHPEMTQVLRTEDLRRHFLIDPVFTPGEITLVYSHLDRMVTGGITPLADPLVLGAPKAVGTLSFLLRREIGIINVGGPGRVRRGGTTYDLEKRDGLYLGLGPDEVSFESANAQNPAHFFVVSTPAHRACPAVKITAADAAILNLGDQSTANKRRVVQYVHPDVCQSCQLVMGITTLEPGNVWNTMPSHTHDRRSEVYLYFDLAAATRIFHMMGEPTQTRHIVMANEQAVLSPPWSIHSGVGTSNYSFIWAMGGDNQDYRDMDAIPMDVLR
jgi:4-deoxy-L-threo-5-hexosulose-uronate ketol-isomerase